ncbi:GC-rich sequence DNA-binding factor-like protein-domain-containing protein [Irpex rosettiformis]|uniref:GC-rich sequence DNA-binding factor-like protein-domain-containing protein n=1 Tax=Irpex rosettiformis TaxID=378272 RepID=A0ACB8UBW5_9APHY|nr:GC-rich sequence DNA-binding factor-like protein-domain-containing protein [Irpex rosettiformis]
MARRKRQMLDDLDSDSDDSNNDFDDDTLEPNDPDARAERELFKNPYKHKRRKKNGKEDAIYGVFGSDDEEEENEGRKGRKRSDWAKAPAFVSGEKVDLDKTIDVDEAMKSAGDSYSDEEGGEDEEAEGSTEEDESSEGEQGENEHVGEYGGDTKVNDEEELDEAPQFGGFGLGASEAGIGSSRGGIGSSKGGIGSSGGLGFGTSRGGIGSSGFSKGGIGSFKAASAPDITTSVSSTPPPAASVSPPVTAEDLNLPPSFGKTVRTQRNFVRDEGSGSGSSTPKPPMLSASERAHFNKISGTFGARMLEKMGWQAGAGLGTSGEGIVTPVESKLRPKGMGLAFKGFKEKTDQAKAEARRRGEAVSDEEVEKRPKKGRKPRGEPKERSDAWKKPKKVKKKIEHKTYEQIVAEAGQDVTSGIGQIIDATGATPREIASLADVSLASWTPTTDAMRLPEIRHNLRLITETCKDDLDGLAKEARSLQERKKWIQQEDERIRKKIEDEAELISRLQQVHLVVDDINTQARDASTSYEATLEPFSSHFEKLIGLYPAEFEKYRLDEIVVAAIAPIMRRLLAQWQPLKDPSAFVSTFRLWRRALKMAEPEDPISQVQVYGSSTTLSSVASTVNPMTPYESLIWNAWLPKVRSCINNDWSPDDPQPAVRLYEAWSRYIPQFVQDNFFDQLVLPKVHRAVSEWNPRKHKIPLQTIVFPWLPHVGLRMEDVLGDTRRKMKSVLRGWTVVEGVPHDLTVWKEIFDSGEWDTMILKYVVPKLGARLREDFRVNPRQQDMAPLQDVLLWETLVRSSILSQILEAEFFPKWLDVLHIWLIQPSPSFEEIAQWYSFWKGSFSENVQNMPGVARGFTRGLQLMNEAIELGPNAPTQLPRPDFRAASPTPASTRPSTQKPRVLPARAQEITFKSIVEEYAASHNLLFMPTGRAHEKSRMPLFRVSQSVDGKGGLLVYIQDDAVWAPDGDDYRAISLENMVLRAMKA